MISKNVTLIEEMPYQKLSKIGITKEDLLSFPRPLLEPLLSGSVTPLLVATIQKPSGEKIDVPLKLQLMREKNGEVNIITYPVRKEILNDNNFSKNDMEKLSLGEVLRKEIRENGNRTQRYFQLDKETNSVIQKDASVLRLSDRMKEIEKIGDIELGLNQKKSILEGKPVELQTGDKTITVGVDLKQPVGFQTLQGDMQSWKKHQEMEYDRLNPGFMGYVKTEANRWEYQQVVQSLKHKGNPQETRNSLKASL